MSTRNINQVCGAKVLFQGTKEHLTSLRDNILVLLIHSNYL